MEGVKGFRAILTMGVSASGKTTWARNFVTAKALSGEDWRVVSRDDFRLSILRAGGAIEDALPLLLTSWDYDRTRKAERDIDEACRLTLRQALSEGAHGVVCADTNLDGGAVSLGFLQELSTKGLMPSSTAVWKTLSVRSWQENDKDAAGVRTESKGRERHGHSQGVRKMRTIDRVLRTPCVNHSAP